MSNYDDIIKLDRPFSKRKKMSIHDRAAQFAPFAALTGYEDQVNETARRVEQRIALDEEAYKELDEKMEIIRSNTQDGIEITVLYFVRDSRKTGGAYLLKTGQVKKIDEDNRAIMFMDKETIAIDDVFSITLPDYLENKVSGI